MKILKYVFKSFKTRKPYLDIEGLSADLNSDFHLVVRSGHVRGVVHRARRRGRRRVVDVFLTILNEQTSVGSSYNKNELKIEIIKFIFEGLTN
jgi:hypothetical protein